MGWQVTHGLFFEKPSTRVREGTEISMVVRTLANRSLLLSCGRLRRDDQQPTLSHSPCPSTTTSMRATRFFLFDVSGLAALLHLTRTEASTAVSRSAEIGVGAVHAIREPLSTRPRRISLDHDVGAGLVKAIQSSGKATGEHTHLFHTLRCSPPV